MRMATTSSRKGTHPGNVGAAARGAGMDGDRDKHWNLSAFEESLARCEAKAYRLAVQLVCCESVAQEIVQDVFSSAWQDMHNVANRSQIETWVYRATVGSALERFDCATDRRHSSDDHCLLFTMTARKFWLRATSDEEPDLLPSPRRSAAVYRRIRRVVNALPKELRAVFILCDLEEMSIGELVEVLGSPSEEVKERLQRARLAIRDGMANTHQFVRLSALAGVC